MFPNTNVRLSVYFEYNLNFRMPYFKNIFKKQHLSVFIINSYLFLEVL